MTRRARSSTSGLQNLERITATLAMGRSHHNQGHLGLAEGCYRQVLALDANNAEALHLLGVVALQSNAAEEAVRLIKRAVRKNPREPAMLVNLGAAHRKAGQLAEARAAYEAALKLAPNLADAYFNLSKVLFDMGDMDGALVASEKCIALNPGQAEAYLNLGNACKFKADSDRAMAAYEQALKLAPGLAQAWGNIAAIHIDRCDFTRAIELLDRAVSLDPGAGELRFKRSLVALRMGDFAQGWEDYESRFVADKEKVPRFEAPPPYWTGEDLKDKTILLWTEQGLGDEVLYASMIGEVIAQARSCIIECSPRMVPVFARSFPAATVVRYRGQGLRTTAPTEFDTQIAVASLGRFFRRSLAEFPRHTGYMKAAAARTAELRARYRAAAPGNLVVGVSWRSKNDSIGEWKSTQLSDWSEVLRVPGVTFVNLQYGDCAQELKAVKDQMGVAVVQDPEVDPMKNVDDFFAQVAAMDMVITTSNTTAHAAGSLNVPTWLLLNSGPAALWYWFIDRDDSPWYPSVRIFRRPARETEPNARDWWRRPAEEMGKALAAKVQGGL